MIVDFSHTGYKTTMQAIEASEAPVEEEPESESEKAGM